MTIQMGMLFPIDMYFNHSVDGKPAPTEAEYTSTQECVWEYDILGMISISMYFLIVFSYHLLYSYPLDYWRNRICFSRSIGYLGRLHTEASHKYSQTLGKQSSLSTQSGGKT